MQSFLQKGEDTVLPTKSLKLKHLFDYQSQRRTLRLWGAFFVCRDLSRAARDFFISWEMGQTRDDFCHFACYTLIMRDGYAKTRRVYFCNAASAPETGFKNTPQVHSFWNFAVRFT
jgi:hypothetical protein